MQSNYTAPGDPLSLDRIRSVLTRLEDTIIFGLIERAQFAHNPRMYQKGAFEELKALDFNGSWLDWFLSETEAFHGTFVRMVDPPTDFHRAFLSIPPADPLSSSKGAEIYQVIILLGFRNIAVGAEVLLILLVVRMNTRSLRTSLNPSSSRRTFRKYSTITP